MGQRRGPLRVASSRVASIATVRVAGAAIQRTVAWPCVSCPDATAAHGTERRESMTRPASTAPSVIARASPAWPAMNAPLDARPSMPTAKMRIATRTSGRVKADLMGDNVGHPVIPAVTLTTRVRSFQRNDDPRRRWRSTNRGPTSSTPRSLRTFLFATTGSLSCHRSRHVPQRPPVRR